MELALMVLAAAIGFASGPIWSVVLIAIFLTIISGAKHGALARRYADVGSARVAMLSVGASAANNLAFACITFAAGRAFAWLVST